MAAMLADEIPSDLRRGVTEYCILGALSRHESYGYELAKTLGAEVGLITNEATLYPILSRLRKLGLVAASWVESPSGPPRRYYRTTPAGLERLARFRRQWSSLVQIVSTLVGEEEP